jgi:hypothetical protein
MFELVFLLNAVTHQLARTLWRSSGAAFFFACALLASNQVFAASNEDLLSIIERLEQRIEQLEANDNEASEVTVPLSTPPSAVSSTLPSPAVQQISTTPPPVPPLELIPPTPSPVTDSKGVWTLFLNLESAQPHQTVQPFTWDDIRRTFRVTDYTGASRLLTVDIAMQGEGKRTRTGRSFLLRRNYDYDFRYVITYQLFLDDDLILSAQKFLSSETLGVDHRGKIPPRIFYDVDNQNVDKIKDAPVQVRFGCQREPTTALTNRREGEAAFRQLNAYACLVLDFDK